MSRTILIMEDEMDMRFYLMALVTSMGYEPLVTRNGVQGLERLKQDNAKVDRILLDVMMPEKGGALVYKELKLHPLFRDIPLVIFSGVEPASFRHYIKMLNLESELEIPEPEYYVEKSADPEYLKNIILQSLDQDSTAAH